MLALLIALTSEFTYSTSIHSMQAANARDEVRAHYLARSAVSISRLLDQDPAALRRADHASGPADAQPGHRRRPGGQPAPDRLRRADHGVLRGLQGGGEDAGQPGRHRRGRGQGAGPEGRPHGRGDLHRGRQDRHQLRQRSDRDPHPADHRVPAAVGAVLLAPLQQPVHRAERPAGSSSSGSTWPGRSSTGPTGTCRGSAWKRGPAAPRTIATTSAAIATGPTTTATTPSRRWGWCGAWTPGMLEAFLPYLTVYASDQSQQLPGEPGLGQGRLHARCWWV